ncbi:helix-turn-helix transcriptional regulator (plasmid) [Chromobacterium amazonense]|uniref:helix-turn-helix transcriptional regulator n=1 Tax=Chromobacterium amazonense TaxID=1382803 RepID=UPI00237EC6BC|nr:helix-turn-helix transcriptional regulator [Chromobacterium amazonense]MDE1715279.1 helix-turn-helix transcriptional regulator [Chromobacterium amazonense]
MHYPVRTLEQLRPLLLGLRKAAGLTQAQLAARLGVTQQSYARLEANPAAASVERLYRALRALDAELALSGPDSSPSRSVVAMPGEDW